MFEGLSAWFSTSVSRSVKQQWVDHGGGETSTEEAQFIFSQDAVAPDTQRVFDSEAYLDEHLAVFHPRYIRECVKHGNVGRVTLGKYFFPPADVQAIAREQLEYQWDLDRNTDPGDTSSSADEEEPTTLTRGLDKTDKSGNPATAPVGHGNSEHKNKDVSRKPGPSGASTEAYEKVKDGTVSGAQRKSGSPVKLPGLGQSDRPKEMEVELKRKSPRKSVRNEIDNIASVSQNKQDRNESEIKSPKKLVTKEGKSQQDCLNVRRKSQSDVVESHLSVNEEDRETQKSHRAKRKRNKSSTSKNEEAESSEILRLDELAKVTGDLQDFIVGKNGCELVKIS